MSTVEPRVLSFDIETDSKGERLLAISLYAPGIDEVLIVDGSDRADAREAPRAASNEYAALDAFCDRVRAVRPRRADRLEHDRLRSHGAAEDRGARCGHPLRSRPRRRRRCGCARPRAISAAARRRSRAGSCSTASTCCAAPSCAWTITRSMPSRARCSAKAKRVAGDVRDRIGEISHNYRARPAGVRAVCAHRRAARVSDRREAQPRAARVRAQPPRPA